MALLMAAAGMLAGGLVGLEYAHRRSQRQALRAVLSDPVVLSELAYIRMVEEAAPVWVMVVQVDTAQLSEKLASCRMQVRVKYGEPGRSLLRRTRNSRCLRTEDGRVCAPFGDTMVFPLRPDLRQVLRLRLARLGFIDRVVSKVELELPFAEGTAACVTRELSLLGQQRRGEVLGTLRVTAEVRTMPRGELRRAMMLEDLPQERSSSIEATPLLQQQAMVVMTASPTPVVRGRVLQPGEMASARLPSAGSAPVVLGVPVAPSGAPAAAGAGRGAGKDRNRRSRSAV